MGNDTGEPGERRTMPTIALWLLIWLAEIICVCGLSKMLYGHIVTPGSNKERSHN
jgi:hypothetical protein